MTYREPTHELGRIMLARHKAQDCVFGCPFCKQEEEANSVKGKLTTLLYDAFGEDEAARLLENLELEAPGYRYDWRVYIPDELVEMWEDLPFEAKAVAMLMAQQQDSTDSDSAAWDE